jgi:hypothetical protein
MRPQSAILCAVEGGEAAAVEEEERGGGQGWRGPLIVPAPWSLERQIP